MLHVGNQLKAQVLIKVKRIEKERYTSDSKNNLLTEVYCDLKANFGRYVLQKVSITIQHVVIMYAVCIKSSKLTTILNTSYILHMSTYTDILSRASSCFCHPSFLLM